MKRKEEDPAPFSYWTTRWQKLKEENEIQHRNTVVLSWLVKFPLFFDAIKGNWIELKLRMSAAVSWKQLWVWLLVQRVHLPPLRDLHHTDSHVAALFVIQTMKYQQSSTSPPSMHPGCFLYSSTPPAPFNQAHLQEARQDVHRSQLTPAQTDRKYQYMSD